MEKTDSKLEPYKNELKNQAFSLNTNRVKHG